MKNSVIKKKNNYHIALWKVAREFVLPFYAPPKWSYMHMHIQIQNLVIIEISEFLSLLRIAYILRYTHTVSA